MSLEQRRPEHKNNLSSLYNRIKVSVISGFRRDVDENCSVLGYYAASSGNSLPTLRCTETSVKYYRSTLRNTPEEGSSASR
jgi:hypothetical protein